MKTSHGVEDTVSLKTDALSSIDDAFNATEDAISLLQRAGYGPETVVLSSLTDALQQMRYVRRAL